MGSQSGLSDTVCTGRFPEWYEHGAICKGRTGLKGHVNLSKKEGRKSESLSKLEDEFTGGKCYFKMGISGAEQNGLAAS